MAKQLNAKFLGLVTALVIGLGGAVALPSAVHAADPAPVGIDLSGLTTTIDNTTGAVTGAVDTTLGDTTGSVTGTVDSTAGAVTGTVDATLGTGTGSASADGSAAAGSTSTSGSASVDATAGTTGTTATDPVSSVVDTVTGVLDGSSTGGSGGSTDPVTNVVDGVTGVLDSGTTGGASDSVANVVNNVASIPVGDNATVGSSVDSTADSVTTTVDPVVAPVIDSCVNLPPAGVSVDLGSSCGGGSGILDPITTAVAPVTDPLANVCLSAAGVDAQAGSTCTGSGGGSGSGDLLGPVTGVVDQGTSTLTPVLGDLSLPSVDTQPVTDTVNQVVNPLDACASVNPLNLNEALGAGCDQPTAPCTTLNVNCLLTSVTDPVIGPGGALDPVLDACLGYDPLGFNLDIGSACAASTPPPTTCPPDCGTTCPPDCGTTCPPDCGPPVCILFCGPIPVYPVCPPDCGTTCPPGCAVTPADPGAAANTASGGSLVLYGPSASATTGSGATGARPPAAPFSGVASAAFAPPDAGDAGLLGRGWGDGSQPLDPALLFIGMFVVACVLGRRRLLHD